jgi:hypothetical protein
MRETCGVECEGLGRNVEIQLGGVFVFSAFVATNTFGMFVNSA